MPCPPLNNRASHGPVGNVVTVNRVANSLWACNYALRFAKAFGGVDANANANATLYFTSLHFTTLHYDYSHSVFILPRKLYLLGIPFQSTSLEEVAPSYCSWVQRSTFFSLFSVIFRHNIEKYSFSFNIFYSSDSNNDSFILKTLIFKHSYSITVLLNDWDHFVGSICYWNLVAWFPGWIFLRFSRWFVFPD